MRLALLTALLLLTSCTVQLKDERIDAASLAAKIEQLDKIDSAIVEKLKELQEKGYLAKSEDKK